MDDEDHNNLRFSYVSQYKALYKFNAVHYWEYWMHSVQRFDWGCQLHCVRKKVNPTLCTTEMWNLNGSCVNFVCFILKYSVKYAQNFVWKYCLKAELSIF